MYVLQQFVPTYLREELNGVLDPIRQRILFQVLKETVRDHQSEETQPTHLIVGTDGSDINDGVGIVKERCPTMPLPTRATDVIHPPLYCAIGVLDNE